MRKRQAINFMISIAADHDDGAEVSCTRLAEACTVEFDCADEGGPLDDETHPIWDWAIEATDRYLRESR